MAHLKRWAEQMSDTNYTRYMEWQRRLAPLSGTIVCATGVLLLVSTFFPTTEGMTSELSIGKRITLGLFFVAVGLAFLRWGLRKPSDPKK